MARFTLRQRRYAALAIFMVVVAAGCSVAGTWQISRFNGSVRANRELRADARAAPVALTPSVVALTGSGPVPPRDTTEYRSVVVSGRYETVREQFVPAQSSGGTDGFRVLTPLRTSDGVLLVLRGFVKENDHGRPPAVTTPPTGSVRVAGRLAPAQGGSDSTVGRIVGEVDFAAQARRLGTPVYQAALTLDAHSPGSAGVRPLPGPDLSNPAGGAYEWQHFAYIVQWYLFAVFALAAPFVMARHEWRAARLRYLGEDESRRQFDEEFEAAADGGAAALPAGDGVAAPAAHAAPPALAGAGGDAELPAVRAGADLALATEAAQAQWARAARLADRYGLSIGDEEDRVAWTRARARRPEVVRRAPASSRDAVHGSDDAYHGAYNDYLWQLALADGELADDRAAPTEPTVVTRTPAAGKIIEHEVADPSPDDDAPRDGADPS